MKTDSYTKIVLTVIAVALVGILFRDANLPLISTAQAQFSQKDRASDVVKVQIVSIDESPSLRWEPIPVKMN
jgi:hypothetical protein